MNDVKRQPWMNTRLESELKAIAENGAVSCAQVQEFAAKNNLDIKQMKPFVDIIGLKVTGCQKLCT